MAYSKGLAARIRDAVGKRAGIVEKKMFGGIAFLLRGNMLAAVWKDSLIVRLGLEEGETALREPHVRVFDITGKPMKGWVVVDPDGLDSEHQLREWLDRAWPFVSALPAK